MKKKLILGVILVVTVFSVIACDRKREDEYNSGVNKIPDIQKSETAQVVVLEDGDYNENPLLSMIEHTRKWRYTGSVTKTVGTLSPSDYSVSGSISEGAAIEDDTHIKGDFTSSQLGDFYIPLLKNSTSMLYRLTDKRDGYLLEVSGFYEKSRLTGYYNITTKNNRISEITAVLAIASTEDNKDFVVDDATLDKEFKITVTSTPSDIE